ncbi:hypothetical protein MVEN_01721400 [Mycena venus]|uniref:Uncharacterized protein n=1 Tax=Mycena venus TaxID=2733690 RepID=A0A8H6XPW7_9AGAR|nr:hypothetical protein MVEN_01721400 [Mycena venus]
MNFGDISPNELGPCTNKACDAGCGQFYGDFVPGVLVGMTRCVICNCYGAQHRRAVSGSTHATFTTPDPPVAPTVAQPPGTSAASSSATASTLFGSRTGQANANPLKGSTSSTYFRDFAKARQQETAAAFKAPTNAPFNPALKAQKEADLNPLAAGSKKRKNNGSTSAPNDRNVKPRPSVKESAFTCVLIPHTKSVARGTCKVPNPQKLITLDEEGFVQNVSFPTDAPPDVVNSTIQNLYSHIPAVEQFGIRVLRTKQPIRRDKRGRKVAKRGKSRILRPLKMAVSVSTLQTALTDSNVRGAGPRFRKIVFLSLVPRGPNLSLGDESDDSDNLDHDLPSEIENDSASEDDSENSHTMSTDQDETSGNKSADPSDTFNFSGQTDATEGSGNSPAQGVKGKGKQKAKDEGTRFHAGYFDEDFVADDDDLFPNVPPPAPDPEPQIPTPTIPDAHKKVERLLKNLASPNMFNRKPTNWWATTPIGSFITGNRSGQICASVCNVYLDTPAQSALAPEHIPAFIQANLCRPFSPLVKLSNHLIGKADRIGSPEFETEFDRSFAAGPGGVHGLIDHMAPAYLALAMARGTNAPGAAISAVYNEVVSLSYALLRCVEHLRVKHNRSQWDPTGGYREFAIIREKRDTELPVATADTYDALSLKMLIDAIHKPRPNVSEVEFMLMDIFGDASDPKDMLQDRVVCGGELGIGRVYDLIAVPILDELEVNHAEYSSLLTLVNVFFLGVARKLRAFIKSQPAAKTEDPGPASASRTTRSKAKRKMGKHDSASGHMTSEEALNSDWPNDCGARDKGTNRKKKARTPSPPIIISSEDSESDREWKRTYAKFARKRGAAGNTKPSQPVPGPGPSAPSAGPQPARSQTRALPVWMDVDARPEDDLEEARNLLKRTRYWQDLLRDILERFPHPDLNRHITLDTLFAPGITQVRQYYMLSLVYHVDRNVSETAHFRAVTAIISQVLNDARSSKLTQP